MKNSQEKIDAIALLEKGVYSALETYSNVHRGSGFKSTVTTHLFEQSRNIVLEYLGLNKAGYTVIFCTARRAKILKTQLNPKYYQIISSKEIGLSIGVTAIAVKKKSLPKGNPFQAGGGTTRLVSKDWVDWTNGPDKFEAGTPAIINIIAFARALNLIKKFGSTIFSDSETEQLNGTEFLYHDNLDSLTGTELLDRLRKTLIGSTIKIPSLEGVTYFINLDNAASTPTFTPVWEAYCKALKQPVPVQQEITREAKKICSKLLGADPDVYDIIFTSNTTEAINLVAENLSRDSDIEVRQVVLNTLMEHSSNDLPWRLLQDSSLIRLTINTEGFIDLKELEFVLSEYNQQHLFGKKRVTLVAVSGASNVLGSCNSLAEISRIVHKYNAQFLVDAAQLIGHRKINMEECGIDYLAFSAHKLYAPFGCGALISRRELLKFSESELQSMKESGEENSAGIAAFAKIAVLLQRIGMEQIHEQEKDLTAKALNALSKVDGLKIYGINSHNQPEFDHRIGVIVFKIEGLMANALAKNLSLQNGIGVRYGCHCAHMLIKHLLNVSPGLERFQRVMLTILPNMKLPGILRVSLGIENTEEDIDRLVEALRRIILKRKDLSSTNDSKGQTFTLFEVKKKISDLINESSIKVYS